MKMAIQTERRKSTIPRDNRSVIHKNCGSLRDRGILKTAGTKSAAYDRNANVLGKRNSSVLAPPNPAYTPNGSTDSFSLPDEPETSPKGFEKFDKELRSELKGMVSRDSSCLIQPPSILHQGINELDPTDAQSVRANRCVLSEQFTAPQMQSIFHAAYRITRNREDAEDATQDALFRAFLHSDDFQGRSAFRTWLMRIAINSSLMILRKRQTARTVSLDAPNDSDESTLFPELRDHALDAEGQCLRKEREATLRHAISALDSSLRNVVELGKLGERSMKDTAETMGVSVAAAKARLFRARQELRTSKELRKLYNYGLVRKGVSSKSPATPKRNKNSSEGNFYDSTRTSKEKVPCH